MYKNATRTRHTRNADYDIAADIEKIKDALNDAAHGVKGRAADILNQSIENAKERGVTFQENVSEFAAEKPFKTIGLALLAGFVIGGFLLRRKKR